MATVTFYLLDQEQEEQLPAHLHAACKLVTQQYRSRRRALVQCDNQQDAEQFDELLWQQPSEAFVPHNLYGEGPAKGAPIEISWQDADKSDRPILINLKQSMPSLHSNYQQIYDFVPASDELKQQARERYKQYRAAGCQLQTKPVSEINENPNG